MTMMFQEDWQSIVKEWATLGIDILKRATGKDWEVKAVLEKWDAKIVFSCGDYSRETAYFDLQRSKEINYRMFLSGLLYGIMSFNRENETKEQTNDTNRP